MISIKYIIIYFILFLFVYLLSCNLFNIAPKIIENFDAFAEFQNQLSNAKSLQKNISTSKPTFFSNEEMQIKLNNLKNQEANKGNQFTLDVNLVGTGTLDSLKDQIKSLKEQIKKSSSEIKFLRRQVK